MEREEHEIQWSKNTDERFCFVVLGEIGAGKSTLLNNLIARVGSDPNSVTDEVEVYDTEIKVPQSGGTTLKLKVRAVDTPGLNYKTRSYDQVFKKVSEKVPHLHALFYCINIMGRFRHSDQQLLSAMSRYYGEDFWKRVVIVLTYADVVQSPMEYMKRFKQAIIMKFLANKFKLDESIAFKIPVCLAALEPSFSPRDYGGQLPEYNWKFELLVAMISVVPRDPDSTPVILKFS